MSYHKLQARSTFCGATSDKQRATFCIAPQPLNDLSYLIMLALLDQVYNWIGFAICHQLTERTIAYQGHPLPVCARDTGIYLGFLISFSYLWLTHRRRENLLPSKAVMAGAVLFVGVMGLDGVTSYLGLRTTTNEIRLVTGLLTGFALPVFLFPVMNYQLWEDSTDEEVLTDWRKAGGLLVLIGLTYLFVWYGAFLPAHLVATIIAASILFTFGLINLLIISILPWWFQTAKKLTDLWLAVSIALLMTAVEIYLAFLMHSYLLKFTQ